MNSKEILAELLRQFPGIGPRQAKRLVYFLLQTENGFIDELAKHILNLKKEVTICETCFRYFNKKGEMKECSICSNSMRDRDLLMVVARDVDLEAIEKSGIYRGIYFVLGGTVPILDKSPETKIRLRELLTRDTTNIKEIILALNATPEGEHTSNIVEKSIRLSKSQTKISKLGRGLSTGTELEYSDKETIKNALSYRF